MSVRFFALTAAVFLGALDAAAAAECLKAEAEGQSVEDRLERARFVEVDYGNRVETVFILNLAKPACLDGADEYDKIESTLKVHVFSMDKAIQRRLGAAIAVPKGHMEALAFVKAFVENAR